MKIVECIEPFTKNIPEIQILPWLLEGRCHKLFVFSVEMQYQHHVTPWTPYRQRVVGGNTHQTKVRTMSAPIEGFVQVAQICLTPYYTGALSSLELLKEVSKSNIWAAQLSKNRIRQRWKLKLVPSP